jgi:hypothetical protein
MRPRKPAPRSVRASRSKPARAYRMSACANGCGAWQRVSPATARRLTGKPITAKQSTHPHSASPAEGYCAMSPFQNAGVIRNHNAHRSVIRMLQHKMATRRVMHIKATPPQRPKQPVSRNSRQLSYSAEIATVTRSVIGISGASTGGDPPSFANDSRHARRQSAAIARASSIVSPCVAKPGIAGNVTTKPPSSADSNTARHDFCSRLVLRSSSQYRRAISSIGMTGHPSVSIPLVGCRARPRPIHPQQSSKQSRDRA